MSTTPNRRYINTHPWITFSFRTDRVTPRTWVLLGEAASKCEHLAGSAMPPSFAEGLNRISLERGAYGTTSIEGNTLTEAEVRDIVEGRASIPPSRAYQRQEIENLVSRVVSSCTVGWVGSWGMVNRPAPGVLLREGDRGELEALVRSRSARAGLVRRARIVLLAADGLSNTEIARRVGAWRTTVIAWRGRYQRLGMDGLEDADRPGRPRKVDHAAIVSATLTPPPKSLGVAHWSTRLLAARLGVSAATVARARQGLRDQAVAGAVVPVFHRPRAGRQGHRHLRPVPGHQPRRAR